MTTILIKRSFAAGVEPSSLAPGELGINVADKKVWVGDQNSVPVLINDKAELLSYLPLAGGTMSGAIEGPIAGDTLHWESGPFSTSISSDGTKLVLSVNDGDTTFTIGVDAVEASRPVILPQYTPEDAHAARVDYVNARIAALGVPTPQVDSLGGVFAAEAPVGQAQYGISTSGAPIFKDIAVPYPDLNRLGGVLMNNAPPDQYVAGIQADGSMLYRPLPAAGTNYVLPAATATILGGVKVGAGITVTADGTISSSGTYILPIASATILGGVKVGAGLAIDAGGILSANAASQYVNKSGDVMTGPLQFAATSVGTFSGTAVYLYYDGTYMRCVMPSGKQGWLVDNATGILTLTSGLKVSAASTFDQTITMTTAVTAYQFGTTGYNVFGGTGGVAVRSNTTNLQTITTGGINNGVQMVTPATGNGVVFGSGGAALSRGSAATKIKSSGAIELPADPVAPLEAATKQYVDSKAGGGTEYTLPTASSTVLGGVKVGAGLAVDASGVLSTSGGASVTNPVAGSQAGLILWVGTQAQYDAIATKSNSTVYNITG